MGAGRLTGGSRGAVYLTGGWERGIEAWVTNDWGGTHLVWFGWWSTSSV